MHLHSVNQRLDFGYLIDPVEPSEFISHYWEQRPLVIQRDQATHYSALLSLQEVELLISLGQLRYPECRLVKDGGDVPANAYVEDEAGIIQEERLYAEFLGGATIILSGVQRHSAALWRFCRNLENFLSHPIQANVYLTPAGGQGFASHFDTHDVFILQIAGTKHWRIYAGPVRLPDDSQAYDTKIEDPGEVLAAYDFGPGTLAYIPRGLVHEGVAADEAALHITLGVPVVTWGELFAEVLGDRRAQDDRFRASLPIGFANGDLRADSIQRGFARLVRELGRLDGLEEALRSMRARLIAQRAPLVEGQSFERLGASPVSAKTAVRRRAGVVCSVRSDMSRAWLCYDGTEVGFPRFLLPMLEFVAAEETFEVASLPGDLENEMKALFVQRLVREALLTVEEGPPSPS